MNMARIITKQSSRLVSLTADFGVSQAETKIKEDRNMKFDYKDKNDKRVVEKSPYALDYPADVDKAPNKAGVYMFIDAEDEVVYVGKASGGRLKDEIQSKKGTSCEKDATKYRWFRTNSDEVAKDLEFDWIKKYQPRNNKIGKNGY